MTRSTLIGLNPDKFNQELRDYPFMVHLDRCNGSIGIFNTLDDPSYRISVPKKI